MTEVSSSGPFVNSPDDDFVRFYEATFARLVAAIRVSGANLSDAEDVVQEAFARTYAHWERVREGANPSGYVYRAALRLHRRRQLRRPTSLMGVTPETNDPASEVVTALLLRETIAKMPRRQRQCVALCLLIGLTDREASRLLGLRAVTVRTHLHNARATLRQALSPNTTAEPEASTSPPQ